MVKLSQLRLLNKLQLGLLMKKKKKEEGDTKEEEKGPLTVVLKVDTDGNEDQHNTFKYVAKLVKWVRGFEGVETVKRDMVSNTVTIIGSIDPSKLRYRLQQWSKGRVHLISPQLNGEPRVTTTVLKMSLHCEGCIKKIQRVAAEFEEVIDTSVDNQNDLITVMGTMDDKALTEYMKEKLKRSVQIVPPKEDKEVKESNNIGDGEDEDNYGGGGGGENKKGGIDDGLLKGGIDDSLLTVVLKLDMDGYKDPNKILKYVANFDGVDAVRCDNNELTIVGDVDPVAIVSKLREWTPTELERVFRQVKTQNINTNDPRDGSVGYDNNNGGGGDRSKEGSGGDDDGNRNGGDKSEGGGGSGKLKGIKTKYMGTRGFDYNYENRAGYEDGYLVGIMMAIVGINQKVAAGVPSADPKQQIHISC